MDSQERGAGVTATTVPTSLSSFLTATREGSVLAVFERSAYLDLGGRVLALTSGPRARGPLAIVVPDAGALRPLAPGDPVHLESGTLQVGGHRVVLNGADEWDASLPPTDLADDAAAHEASYRAVLAELRARPPAESMVSLVERALDAIGDVLSGTDDPARLSRTVAHEIAGRGPGLTPSGDDLLLGITHALTLWPRLAVRVGGIAIRQLIADAARPHTTRISAAYLDAAARGLATEPWHDLVRILHCSGPDLQAAARRLLQMGETSGADALTGFCWAWRRLFA
jgi:hypothetical protein